MRKEDVVEGAIYWVKVSERIVPVRILREALWGGWIGQNLITGREVHVRTAGRLRGLVRHPAYPQPEGLESRDKNEEVQA